MEQMKIRRQDLYEKVWSTPMRKLAEDFGISDVGLAKICKRHRIPVPGRGYWQKRASGENARRIPLPVEPAERFNEILIAPTRIGPPKKDESPEVRAQIEFEERPENRIVVPDHVARYLPLVHQTKLSLEGSNADGRGILTSGRGTLDVRVSRPQMGRALRLLDTFLRKCETRGFGVEVSKESRKTDVVVLGERITFRLEERSRRTEHVPNRKEAADLKAGHSWYVPKWDYLPGAKLTFLIDEYGLVSRRSWSDGKHRALEESLNEIMVALVRVALYIIRPRRLEHEKWERDRAERQRREDEERRRQELLQDALKGWRQRRELRFFLEDIRAEFVKAGVDLAGKGKAATWLRWAERLSGHFDPVPELLEKLQPTVPGSSDTSGGVPSP